MRKPLLMMICVPVLLAGMTQVRAEARREGGDDALRKAQYMLRELSNEKKDLQAQVAELQGKLDEFGAKQKAADAKLSKLRSNNKQLVSRVESDISKYKALVERYRHTVKTLRLAGTDNQYLVRAVQEREEWIASCREDNKGLFEANTDLLARYKKAKTRFSDPITGISTVSVENETQEYRFKLEDLQVTKFKPVVNVQSHVREQPAIVGAAADVSAGAN